MPHLNAATAANTVPSLPLKPRQIALASLVGTTIEWYDFFIYGTAATLVFAHQFFPGVSPVAGTLAALSSYAVGFVARPLGGVLMGHLGDRIGRKRMLVASLVIMGGSTVLVGVLPPYSAIGIAAPVLLVSLRLVQGLGVGGEWGGAVLMSLEHAPPARRTLYASFPQLGLPIGIVLASLSFLALQLAIGDAAFRGWGWRVPFLASAVLVALGFFLRQRVSESPEFVAARRRGDVSRAPVVELFRTMPVSVLQACGVSMAFSAVGNIVFVWVISYAVAHRLATAPTMLGLTVASAATGAVAVYLGARLATRYGRRRMLLTSTGLCALWAFPYCVLLDSGSLPRLAGACVVAGLLQGLGSGQQAGYIADAFPVTLRYTGASVAYGVGGVAGGGLAPIVATALVAATGATAAVAAYLVGVCALSLLATATLRSAVPTAEAAQSGVTPTHQEQR
jgi:MFS family permease